MCMIAPCWNQLSVVKRWEEGKQCRVGAQFAKRSSAWESCRVRTCRSGFIPKDSTMERTLQRESSGEDLEHCCFTSHESVCVHIPCAHVDHPGFHRSSLVQGDPSRNRDLSIPVPRHHGRCLDSVCVSDVSKRRFKTLQSCSPEQRSCWQSRVDQTI